MNNDMTTQKNRMEVGSILRGAASVGIFCIPTDIFQQIYFVLTQDRHMRAAVH